MDAETLVSPMPWQVSYFSYRRSFGRRRHGYILRHRPAEVWHRTGDIPAGDRSFDLIQMFRHPPRLWLTVKSMKVWQFVRPFNEFPQNVTNRDHEYSLRLATALKWCPRIDRLTAAAKKYGFSMRVSRSNRTTCQRYGNEISFTTYRAKIVSSRLLILKGRQFLPILRLSVLQRLTYALMSCE